MRLAGPVVRAVFTLLLAGFVFISGCGKKEPETRTERPPILVEALVVQAESFQETVASSAVIRAHEEFRISTQVDGMLLEKKVDRGDRVKKNQILFEIESEPFDLQVRDRTALLNRAWLSSWSTIYAACAQPRWQGARFMGNLWNRYSCRWSATSCGIA